MAQLKLRYIFPALLLIGGLLLAAPPASPLDTSAPDGLPPPTAGNGSYDKVMSVLTHPRCINCHPSDHLPKQGLEGRPHHFGVARGAAGHGFEATNCNTCHQSENNDYSGVPGAPHWGLAPASMGWQGLSRAEVAEALLDRSRNGNRGHEALIHHLTEDPLVLWAWSPGVDAAGQPREKPPVAKEAYIKAVKDWFAAGAPIPR